MVEHSAVNRRVASSSLARGAKKPQTKSEVFLFDVILHTLSKIKNFRYALHCCVRKSAKANPKSQTKKKKFTSRYRTWEIVYKLKFKEKKISTKSRTKVESLEIERDDQTNYYRRIKFVCIRLLSRLVGMQVPP